MTYDLRRREDLATKLARADVVMREVDKVMRRAKAAKVGHYLDVGDLGDLLLAVQKYRNGKP